MTSGIYQIRNKINGHYYIGSSKNIEQRIRDHCNALIKSKHDNIHLQHAWNKYGRKCFDFEIIQECCEEDLLMVEQSYLDYAPEYNISLIAGKVEWNEETRNKLANSRKGISISEDTKRKMSEALLGNSFMAGHVMSEDSRERMSRSQKGNTNSLGNKSRTGKVLSQEEKDKHSKFMKLWWKNKKETHNGASD